MKKGLTAKLKSVPLLSGSLQGVIANLSIRCNFCIAIVVLDQFTLYCSGSTWNVKWAYSSHRSLTNFTPGFQASTNHGKDCPDMKKNKPGLLLNTKQNRWTCSRVEVPKMSVGQRQPRAAGLYQHLNK